ncbi:MAG: hypothetical protein AAF533_03415 [Acidobacteriota bacterium]
MTSTDDLQREAWRPPEGFVPVRSGLPGFTIFAPAPPDQGDPDFVRVGRCDRCGGEARYDAAIGRLRCGHCASQREVAAVEVGRAASEEEFRVETLERAARGWGAERTQVHCESCGADTVLAARELVGTCAFCTSQHVVARPAPQDALRPRYLLPFQVDADEARRLLTEWLGSGWLQPRGLSKQGRTTSIQAVYLPAWTFDARVVAHWMVETGRPLSDESNITIWTKKDGKQAVHMDDELSLAVGDLSELLFSRIAPFDLDRLVEYDPELLAGWQVRVADVPLEKAWERQRLAWRDRPREEAWKRLKSQHAKLRRFSAAVDFTKESWRHVLLPVHVVAYRHRDETHHVLINGRTGVIAGQRPVAWWKVLALIAFAYMPAALLGGIGALAGHPLPELIVPVSLLAVVATGFAGWLLGTATGENDA